MSHILIIGGTSTDILHLETQTAPSAGGAGMYTAMAAHRCGSNVSLFAPHPDPIPDVLQSIAERLTVWFGPIVNPEEGLPHFEISQRGGKTEYLKATFGAESTLTPDMLPADLSKYDCIHIVPLGDAQKQLDFITACRKRGAKKISAGTYLTGVDKSPHLVHSIIAQTDIFFMNQSEAVGLFGSLEAAHTEAGKLLFITLGADGACAIQGNYKTFIPAVPTTELDPTGAGDTFCGATLAYLAQGKHPIIAAQHAVPLAAQMIAHVGPTALLFNEPSPEISNSPKAQTNPTQIQKISKMVAALDEAAPFNFISPELPPAHHPKTLDYFFAVTLQQFSFWNEKNNRYHTPLVAPLGGVSQKGAFYLFDAYRRRLESDADFCSPERQANLSRAELLEIFKADDGTDPMPALDLHLEMANAYGGDMLALRLTPEVVLQQAGASPTPLRTLISILDKIGGYKEDPLRKKSGLLALILNQRPEAFLTFADGEQVEPVIDYHLMRSCLRVGLVDILDEELKTKITNRELISPADEWAIRLTAFRAIEEVVALSGKSTGAVDWFFFGARKRCPEMTEPECHLCQIDSVCAHRRELFQPVLRTGFY